MTAGTRATPHRPSRTRAVKSDQNDNEGDIYDHGSVLETGTHAELLDLGGQYAELYTLQASQYEL